MIAVSTMGAACANVLLNYVFIQQFGYYAAGYTTLICYVLYAILHYFVLHSICKIECNNEKILNPAVIAIIALLFMIIGFAVMLLYHTILVRYLLVIGLIIVAIIMRHRLIEFYKVLKNRTE
jgi:O-antigen/teichoic acid export membrane protein